MIIRCEAKHVFPRDQGSIAQGGMYCALSRLSIDGEEIFRPPTREKLLSSMASFRFYGYLVVVLQIVLVLSGLVYVVKRSKKSHENPTIPLSTLVHKLRNLSYEDRLFYVEVLFLTTGKGARLFDLSKDASPECYRTARASLIVTQTLAYSKEAVDAESESAAAVTRDLNTTVEHPSELVCQKYEKLAANSTFSAAFKMAKENAGLINGSQPPFIRGLDLTDQYLEKVADAKAKLLLVNAFISQLNPKWRLNQHNIYLFVASAVEVAKEQKFAGLMQSLYEKALNDTTQVVIRINGTFAEKFRQGYHCWTPVIANSFYGYIAKDPTLKAEIAKRARIIDKNASSKDLDFTNFSIYQIPMDHNYCKSFNEKRSNNTKINDG